MPTPIGSPWPSEPVATSTSGTFGIGWPWSRDPSFRKVRSSSSSMTPTALSIAYSSGDAWPLENTTWSLLGSSGRSTSKRRCSAISTAIRSAADIDEVGWPDPAAADARTESTRSCCPSSAHWAASIGIARTLRRRAREGLALAGDLAQELRERVGELLDALALERQRDVVVIDAGVAQRVERGLRPVDVLLDGQAADLAVVLEGLDRLLGHRVDRVAPDQLLDVQHVAVVGVLRRRRCPQAPLRRGALVGQRVPALAGERPQVGLIRELRVGHRRTA